jgi:hypothetical protein
MVVHIVHHHEDNVLVSRLGDDKQRSQHQSLRVLKHQVGSQVWIVIVVIVVVVVPVMISHR